MKLIEHMKKETEYCDFYRYTYDYFDGYNDLFLIINNFIQHGFNLTNGIVVSFPHDHTEDIMDEFFDSMEEFSSRYGGIPTLLPFETIEFLGDYLNRPAKISIVPEGNIVIVSIDKEAELK